MRHGYEVTLKQLVKASLHRGDYVWDDPCKGIFPSQPSPVKMTPSDITSLREALRRSSRRTIGIWSRSDPASFALLGMTLIYGSIAWLAWTVLRALVG